MGLFDRFLLWLFGPPCPRGVCGGHQPLRPAKGSPPRPEADRLVVVVGGIYQSRDNQWIALDLCRVVKDGRREPVIMGTELSGILRDAKVGDEYPVVVSQPIPVPGRVPDKPPHPGTIRAWGRR